MTPLSLPALSQLAEQNIAWRGPLTTDELVQLLAHRAGAIDRAQAGVRLAVITGRLTLDRDATVRLSAIPEAA
jgi:hypothetical protein